jgi:hypothetical protein
VNATELSSDGAAIMLTVAHDADRTGHTYPEAQIAPDTSVPVDWTQIGVASDPVVMAAAQWLQAQPPCHP